MNVAQLIEALQELPDYYPVDTIAGTQAHKVEVVAGAADGYGGDGYSVVIR